MLKGRLMTCPGDVTVTVHEPLPTAGVTRAQARAFAERVREIVRGAVDEPPSPSASVSQDSAPKTNIIAR